MSNNVRIDLNDYEFNEESKLGCYIIHGFSSSTYETKELAEFLGENGYHTLTRNLPGHGTDVDECNRVKYQDWLSFIEQDIADLSNKVDKICVIGMSMGGALALHIASLFPVECMISAAPVIVFKKPLKLKYLNSVLCTFIPTISKASFYPKDIRDDLTFFGYDQYPMIALNEFRKMNKGILDSLNKIKCPTLLLHSNKDETSLPENIEIIKNKINSKIILTKYYDNATHNIFVKSNDQKNIFNDVLLFLQEYIS
ncbi:MAG: alpha/beta fold hydrolase [Candidatus Marinimicrobia bacterium]|nr:alpha/beta fold hydrolase [Candidatus Neomarinimicrobiota bacterium]